MWSLLPHDWEVLLSAWMSASCLVALLLVVGSRVAGWGVTVQSRFECLGHTALGRGIPGGEPMVAHGVPEKKKTRPSARPIALLPLPSGHTSAGLSAGSLTSLL